MNARRARALWRAAQILATEPSTLKRRKDTGAHVYTPRSARGIYKQLKKAYNRRFLSGSV